ncbi:MAG: T9SS type A sorting domain-containing protein [Flavobacteriales bacterium]|nr:T9SS type A sorting domain-containing protein [Flavobacteriales bacterium]
MKKILTLMSLITLFSLNSFAQIGPVTQICLVTVDTSLTHNVVVWERADQVSVNTIDSIYIYRRVPGTGDSLIAKVDYDSLSEYHDYDANPNLKPYIYRIAGKDVLGQLGPQSIPHSTIHFIAVENGSGEFWLKWTPYVGRNIDYYQCWDMTQTPQTPDLVNSTVDDQDTSWQFSSATPGTYQMKVDVSWIAGCTSTKANHNTTRSNQATGIFTGTGGNVSVEEEALQEVIASPNPTNDIVRVTFSSTTWHPIKISVIDINGRTVLSCPEMKVMGQYYQEIDLSVLSPGIYNVLLDNGLTKTIRVVKN